LGDRLGARRIYLAGLAVFTLASALCGAATNLPVLTAARILQGAGAAMLVPCSLSLINHAYPDPVQRAGAIALWAGFGGAAMASGPLVGGVLIQLLGWRGIFLVNLPVGLVGLWLTARIGTETPATPGRHLDLAGQVIAVVALGLPVVTLIQGPALGWGSLLILAGLVGSGVAWAVFLWLEAHRAQPMLPLTLFAGRVFSASVLVSMATAFTFYGFVFSRHTTGRRGVAGRQYTPSTSCIWQTNSAECLGGMHHICRRCGLRTFLPQHLAHRLVAQVGNNLQGHHLPGQEPQRPALLARRRVRTGKCNQPRLLRPVQLARINPLARLGQQGCLQPVLDKALAHPLKSAHADPQRFRDRPIRPAWSRLGRIRSQQNPRMGQLASVRLATRNHPIKRVSLLPRQRHPIPLGHPRLPPLSPLAADQFRSRQNNADEPLDTLGDLDMAYPVSTEERRNELLAIRKELEK